MSESQIKVNLSKQHAKMKSKLTYSFIVLSGLLLACGMASQSETDADKDKGATPVIKYARTYNAQTEGSPIVSAPLGSRLEFVGDNLGDVQQIWFNDQKAELNHSTIKSHSIIVDIPDATPGEMTNMVRFITSKGTMVDYPFNVSVPAPRVDALTCGYADARMVVTISGAYFADDPNTPLTVTFADNLPATIKDISQEALVVEVPDGAKEGAVRVTSIYGSGESSFHYLDTHNTILGFGGITDLGINTPSIDYQRSHLILNNE